jgi:hypothetical protein
MEKLILLLTDDLMVRSLRTHGRRMIGIEKQSLFTFLVLVRVSSAISTVDFRGKINLYFISVVRIPMHNVGNTQAIGEHDGAGLGSARL